jgi:hypothetical protein
MDLYKKEFLRGISGARSGIILSGSLKSCIKGGGGTGKVYQRSSLLTLEVNLYIIN